MANYGKIFDTVFSGTLFGSGPTVFAVWAYVIASAKPPGVVELNPKLLAACIGTDIGAIKEAIDVLCAPDTDSRNAEHDGCRLLPLGSLQYHVVSFDKYREVISLEEKREADRIRIAEKRKKARQDATPRDMSQPVAECSGESPKVAEVAEGLVKEREEKKKTTRAVAHVGLTIADLTAEGVDGDVAAAWLRVRKEKRAGTLSRIAWDALKREAARAGWTAPDAVLRCVERNWISFTAKYVADERAPGKADDDQAWRRNVI